MIAKKDFDKILFADFLFQVKGGFVPEKYFKKQIDCVSEWLRRLNFEELDVKNWDLIDRISLNIKKKVTKGKSLCILAGGGVDSNFLIILTRLLFPEKKIYVICGLTKNNQNDLNSTKLICDKYRINMYVYAINDHEKEQALIAFLRHEERYPYDVTMPLLYCLIKKGYDIDSECEVMDGQFADTVLFANPQNLLYNCIKGLKVKNVIAFKLLNSFKERFIRDDRLKLVIDLVLKKESEKILLLSRVENTNDTVAIVEDLLQRFSSELVFQAIFFKLLLEYRERDKYRLNKDVISPFDDDVIFKYSYVLLGRRCILRKKKKELHNFIRFHCPSSVTHMKSRSFEPE